MLKTSPIRKSTRAYCQNSARSASFEFHILVEDNILEVGDNVVYK